MDRLLILLASCLALLTASAAPVTAEQARTAVGRWLGMRGALGCRLGTSVSAVRTCAPADGARFHVVQLAGGGFVVTSSDTRLEPVVAFSGSDDLVESDANPLWSLLKGDLAARAQALDGASLQSVAPGGAARPTAEEARWAKLLDGAVLQSVTSVSDVRVEPLVRSKWGQSQNSIYSNWGGPCYNYYTPNNYVCGCVATALAQLMRFHRHPSNPKTVATRTCAVDGVQRAFTMMGGPYAYDDMPLVPEAYTWASGYAGGATEVQRQAIGRLTYDCGVAMQMSWGSGGSGSGGAAAHGPLKTVFGYGCAHTTTAGLGDAAYRDRILRTNLDAGYPVLLGIGGPSGGHEILADGYGFSSSVLYTHLNMGWSGSSDAWYALPDIGTTYAFDTVTHAVFNVMPDRTGEIVSGRVVTSAGEPVEDAAVTIRRNGYSSQTVRTGARGIYAFVVPSPSSNTKYSYTVSATCGAVVSGPATASVRATKDSNVTLEVGSYTYYPNAAAPTCGNVLCDDLVLDPPPPSETSTTEAPVPYAWLDARYPGAHTAAEYETLARADSDGDGFAAWQEYLCGTDPTRADDRPRCAIEMREGAAHVTHNVVVPAAAAELGWTAVLMGSDDLAGWQEVPDAASSGRRFFKVVVRRR